MKFIWIIFTIALLSAFSMMLLNDERFIACVVLFAASIFIGALLYRVSDATVSKVGWGILYGSLTVMTLEVIYIVYSLLTWKITHF
jgi:hypothetical protein